MKLKDLTEQDIDAMSYDAETGNPVYKTIVSHNLNRDEEIETIRYIITHTTAGSVKIGTDEIAIQGLVPNDTDVTLRDIITYCKNHGYTFARITEATPKIRHGINN